MILEKVSMSLENLTFPNIFYHKFWDHTAIIYDVILYDGNYASEMTGGGGINPSQF
jgi:hypothetical protein